MSRLRITRRRLFVALTVAYAALGCADAVRLIAQETPRRDDGYRVTALGGSSLRQIDGEKVLEFQGGVRIDHGNVTITSRRGLHYTDRRVTNLIGDVKIVQETLTMWGDEGVYTGPTDQAVLRRNVRIVDEGWEVTCDEATYSRKTGDAWLSGHVVARDSVSTLHADRLFYNRITEMSEAFGNVEVTNREEGFTARGDHGLYFRDRGEAVIDRNPRLVVDPDSPEPVSIASDTMRVFPDSSRALAYYRVKIIKGSTVTQCDSAVLYDDRNRAELYGSPMAREENVSMSGHMMALHYDDEEVHRIDIRGGAEIRELQKDSLVVGRDSWIQGDTVTLFLHENRVDSIRVDGNARSEYYPGGGRKVEGNSVRGDEMFFRFERDSLVYVRVTGNASGVYRYLDLAENETVDSLRALADTTLAYRAFRPNAEKVVYSARNLEYFAKTGDLELDQSARLLYQNSELSGDDITYFSSLHLLDAQGSPTLTDKGETFYGDRMNYDMESQSGLVANGSTKFQEGYYTGENVAKVSDDEMKVWGSNYTTCDLKVPHYHFRAKEMKVYPRDKVITGPIWLYIGDTPIAYLPFMATNLRRGRRSGILRPEFEFGFDRSGGRYIRNWGYYWATNDYTDFSFRGDFNEDQSFRVYTENRYALRYRFTGGIKYNFFRNLRTNRSEWDVAARHDHTLGEKFSLTSDVRFVSSDLAPSSINRIDDVDRVTDRAIRSNISLRKQWDTVGFSASASRQQNLSVTTPGAVKLAMTAPDVTLSIPSRNLFFGERSRQGREGFWERVLGNTRYSPSLSGRRTYTESEFTSEENITVNQGLGFQSPQKFGFLTISPSLRMSNASTRNVLEEVEHTEERVDFSVSPAETTTVTIPSRSTTTTDNQFSWNTGASMSTNFYGTFYPRIGRLRGIRHTVSPQASWTYTPDFGNEGPSRQGVTVSVRQSLDLKVLARDRGPGVGEPTAAGAAEAARGGEGDENSEERLNKLSGVVLWTLSSSYNPQASKRQGWATINSAVNTNLLGTSVSMNQRIDPYELDVLGTTIQSGIRLQGTHPFGKSSSVTIRELNVVAASDTVGTERGASATWEETGDPSDRLTGESRLALEEGRLPWSVSMDVSYTKTANADPRSTLQLRGEMDLTPAWSVSYSTTYDVEERLLLGQNYRITRDLHCWQMSFSRQRLGDEWQFYFRINLKAHQEIYAEQGRRGLGGGAFGQGSFGF